MTKAQKNVLFLMKEGWVLHHSQYGKRNCWLSRFNLTETVSIATLFALKQAKAIKVKDEWDHDSRSTTYTIS